MDDLINRKAAIEAVKHAWAKGLEPSQYIEIIPSAPAVPMDKFCEWLAKNASWYAVEIDGDSEEWKSILTEWMEEQDASPQ